MFVRAYVCVVGEGRFQLLLLCFHFHFLFLFVFFSIRIVCRKAIGLCWNLPSFLFSFLCFSPLLSRWFVCAASLVLSHNRLNGYIPEEILSLPNLGTSCLSTQWAFFGCFHSLGLNGHRLIHSRRSFVVSSRGVVIVRTCRNLTVICS